MGEKLLWLAALLTVLIVLYDRLPELRGELIFVTMAAALLPRRR